MLELQPHKDLSLAANEWVQSHRSLLEAQRTLEDVVRWGLLESPPKMIQHAINLDEFTLEIIVPVRIDLTLVYDTT